MRDDEASVLAALERSCGRRAESVEPGSLAVQGLRLAYPQVSFALGRAGRGGVRCVVDLAVEWPHTESPPPAPLPDLSVFARLRLLSLVHVAQLDLPGLTRLTTLEDLTLVSHTLASLPADLGNLRRLRNLAVRGRFQHLPDSLGLCSVLRCLDVRAKLVELPGSVGELARLERLRLGGNALVMLPSCIGRLTRLRELDVEFNRLTALPDLGALRELTRLNAKNNQGLSGPVDWVGDLELLEDLDLEWTAIRALPDLRRLTRLRRLVAPLDQVPTGLSTTLTHLQVPPHLHHALNPALRAVAQRTQEGVDGMWEAFDRMYR
jgi:hypothetical protein